MVFEKNIDDFGKNIIVHESINFIISIDIQKQNYSFNLDFSHTRVPSYLDNATLYRNYAN